MTRIEIAKDIRKKLDNLINNLSDDQAIENSVLFKRWNGNGTKYYRNEKILFQDILYTVLQDHTSQPDWSPDITPALFSKVLVPTPGEIPDWVQPSSTNGYSKGDKVRFQGDIYMSLIDNNVWSPIEYTLGWEKL